MAQDNFRGNVMNKESTPIGESNEISIPVQRMRPFIHTPESMLEDLQVTSGILHNQIMANRKQSLIDRVDIQALEAKVIKQNQMIELLAAKTTKAVETVASALHQIIDRVDITAQHVRDLESEIAENTCLDGVLDNRFKDLESKVRNCIKTLESMGGAK
jgi:hypothetical protein